MPPEGMMWNPWVQPKLPWPQIPIVIANMITQFQMTNVHLTGLYWRNDPSYDWARKVRARRESKR
jgi:hypothetical protein